MRHSRGALAKITHVGEGGCLWLLRWNRKWESYALIGGHLEPGETYRECLLREIHEEIGLKADDLCVSMEPIETLSYVAFSKRANEETQYTLLLFDAVIHEEARSDLSLHDDTLRWVSAAEIEARRTHDGKGISDVVGRVYGVLQERTS